MSSLTAFAGPTTSVSSATSSSLIIGLGTVSEVSDMASGAGVSTSRSMASITNGRKAGLS